MIIRGILNKAQYLKLFFFAMGIIVGYELNAESIQMKKILIHSNYIQKI